eukprot:SAG31_NODE_10717_length_1106_cov_30.406157_1_plen_136_part_00
MPSSHRPSGPRTSARGAEQLQATDNYGWLPMQWAAWKNTSVDVVRVLLEVGGAEQLRATEHGSLPMQWAAWKNTSVDVVQVLLEAGGAEQLQATNTYGSLPPADALCGSGEHECGCVVGAAGGGRRGATTVHTDT